MVLPPSRLRLLLLYASAFVASLASFAIVHCQCSAKGPVPWIAREAVAVAPLLAVVKGRHDRWHDDLWSCEI